MCQIDDATIATYGKNKNSFHLVHEKYCGSTDAFNTDNFNEENNKRKMMMGRDSRHRRERKDAREKSEKEREREGQESNSGSITMGTLS